jgi:hypothetical protein
MNLAQLAADNAAIFFLVGAFGLWLVHFSSERRDDDDEWPPPGVSA